MKTEKVFFKKRNELNLAAFIYNPLDQHSRFYENGTLEEVIIINTRFKDHPNEKQVDHISKCDPCHLLSWYK